MKNIKYYIGLDVHKERTTYVVRNKIGNILLENETATIYSELYPQLKPYVKHTLEVDPRRVAWIKATFQQALASRPQRRQSSIAALDRLIKYGLPRRQPHESGVWGYF